MIKNNFSTFGLTVSDAETVLKAYSKEIGSKSALKTENKSHVVRSEMKFKKEGEQLNFENKLVNGEIPF